MNYKILSALTLSFLLLIPAGLIATQTVRAHQFVQPALSVIPPVTKFFGPCLVSTYFPIDVLLWNNPLAGEDVYAFDFSIDWSSIPAGYITLVNATAHSPWANFFTIANSNVTADNGTITNWHLAMTAIPPSTGLTDVNQSVLTLVFHIDKDVCFPNSVIGFFNLLNVTMSGDGTKPVVIPSIEVDNGVYEQISLQPNIELSTTDAAYNATTNTITEKCNSHTFDIEVDLTDVTNAYGFDFYMKYNPSELETDAQHITFKAAFPPPYETLVETISTDGIIHITVIRPSEKPAVCGALVPAVDIVFHSLDTKDGKAPPTTDTSTISITSASIFAKCPDPVTYTSVATPKPYTGGFHAAVDTNGAHPGAVLAGESFATVTDNCSDLFVTVGITNPGDAFWFSGGAQIVFSYGGQTVGFIYDPTKTYFGFVYGYYNGTTWQDATLLLDNIYNFTATKTATSITFDIPFANLPLYFGQTLTFPAGSGFQWWNTGGAELIVNNAAFTYTQQNLVTIGDPITYKFKPSKYDLNLDCVVDIQDLMKLLPYYGKISQYSNLTAIVYPAPVDIFDFVAIAKHFGPVDP